jgi:hypothetical protein
MNVRYTVQGITDERESCDCCGRTGLKRVVVLLDAETDDFVYFGTTCAARAKKVSVKAVKADIKTAESKARAAREAVRRAAYEARQARWVAHLVELTGGIFDNRGVPDIFRMIEAAGGYSAAHEGF